MEQDDHQDVYRVAYDSAQSELNEIVVSFEQLRVRKESVENLVAVLQPMVDAETKGTSMNQPSGESSGGNQDAKNSSADPFQRRIDNVLGIGSAGKYNQRN